jgi:hypothetical protein
MMKMDETLQLYMLHLYGKINTQSCGANGINLYNVSPKNPKMRNT